MSRCRQEGAGLLPPDLCQGEGAVQPDRRVHRVIVLRHGKCLVMPGKRFDAALAAMHGDRPAAAVVPRRQVRQAHVVQKVDQAFRDGLPQDPVLHQGVRVEEFEADVIRMGGVADGMVEERFAAPSEGGGEERPKRDGGGAEARLDGKRLGMGLGVYGAVRCGLRHRQPVGLLPC